MTAPKVTLRQQRANALKDFIYVDGVVVGEATFLAPGYRVNVQTPTGVRVGKARSRSAVRAAVKRLIRRAR